MSRPIKFRVWDTLNRFYRKSDDHVMSPDMTRLNNIDDGRIVSYLDGDSICVEQFTGLLDSKGVEIYEGDIIRGTIYGHQQWGEVEYVGRGFQAEDKVRLAEAGNSVWIPVDARYPTEVIGNKHQNPELLKS